MYYALLLILNFVFSSMMAMESNPPVYSYVDETGMTHYTHVPPASTLQPLFVPEGWIVGPDGRLKQFGTMYVPAGQQQAPYPNKKSNNKRWLRKQAQSDGSQAAITSASNTIARSDQQIVRQDEQKKEESAADLAVATSANTQEISAQEESVAQEQLAIESVSAAADQQAIATIAPVQSLPEVPAPATQQVVASTPAKTVWKKQLTIKPEEKTDLVDILEHLFKGDLEAVQTNSAIDSYVASIRGISKADQDKLKIFASYARLKHAAFDLDPKQEDALIVQLETGLSSGNRKITIFNQKQQLAVRALVQAKRRVQEQMREQEAMAQLSMKEAANSQPAEVVIPESKQEMREQPASSMASSKGKNKNKKNSNQPKKTTKKTDEPDWIAKAQEVFKSQIFHVPKLGAALSDYKDMMGQKGRTDLSSRALSIVNQFSDIERAVKSDPKRLKEEQELLDGLKSLINDTAQAERSGQAALVVAKLYDPMQPRKAYSIQPDDQDALKYYLHAARNISQESIDLINSIILLSYANDDEQIFNSYKKKIDSNDYSPEVYFITTFERLTEKNITTEDFEFIVKVLSSWHLEGQVPNDFMYDLFLKKMKTFSDENMGKFIGYVAKQRDSQSLTAASIALFTVAKFYHELEKKKKTKSKIWHSAENSSSIEIIRMLAQAYNLIPAVDYYVRETGKTIQGPINSKKLVQDLQNASDRVADFSQLESNMKEIQESIEAKNFSQSASLLTSFFDKNPHGVRGMLTMPNEAYQRYTVIKNALSLVPENDPYYEQVKQVLALAEREENALHGEKKDIILAARKAIDELLNEIKSINKAREANDQVAYSQVMVEALTGSCIELTQEKIIINFSIGDQLFYERVIGKLIKLSAEKVEHLSKILGVRLA